MYLTVFLQGKAHKAISRYEIFGVFSNLDICVLNVRAHTFTTKGIFRRPRQVARNRWYHFVWVAGRCCCAFVFEIENQEANETTKIGCSLLLVPVVGWETEWKRASTWPSYMRIVVSECCFRLLLCMCMRHDAFIPKIFYFCSSFYYSITTKSADLLPRRCVLIPEGLLSMLHTILRCDSFFLLGWCVENQIDHFGVDEKKDWMKRRNKQIWRR